MALLSRQCHFATSVSGWQSDDAEDVRFDPAGDSWPLYFSRLTQSSMFIPGLWVAVEGSPLSIAGLPNSQPKVVPAALHLCLGLGSTPVASCLCLGHWVHSGGFAPVSWCLGSAPAAFSSFRSGGFVPVFAPGMDPKGVHSVKKSWKWAASS